jgi:hypothetical protein
MSTVEHIIHILSLTRNVKIYYKAQIWSSNCVKSYPFTDVSSCINIGFKGKRLRIGNMLLGVVKIQS